MREEYGRILEYIIIGGGIGIILIVGSMLIAEQKGDREKNTAYECGFDPFEDARDRFDVRYYVVAIMFIVFDIEASYLYPWSVVLEKTGGIGYYGGVDFIIELGIGYIYAWKEGALEEKKCG